MINLKQYLIFFGKHKLFPTMGPNQWEANSQFWVFNDGLRGGRSTLFWRHLVRGQSGPDHRVQKSPGPWRVIRWQKASRGHLAPSPPSQDPPGHLVSHLSSQPSSKCSTSSNCCLYGRAQAQVTFRLVKMWQLNLPTNIYKSSNNKKYQQISTNLPTI